MAQPIIWASQTVSGRQDTNDGSRLKDIFAVNPQSPREASFPTILYATPGHKPYIAVTGRTVSGTNVADSINGFISVDSPTYGRRLYGISEGYNFFEVREGGSHASSVPENYNPYIDSSGDDVENPTIETTTSVRNFTTLSSERYKGPARLAGDGRRVVFIRGRSVVMWDMAANSGAGGFVTVHAPTPSNASATLGDEDWVDLTWIDGYFVLLARNGQIYHSQLQSDVFNQLDFATAERNPDPGVGLAAYGARLYVFGSRTVELYYNAGRSTFAFARDNSITFTVGCAALHTIQVNEGGVFFLGSDKIFYGIGPKGLTKLSTDAVEYDIARCKIEDTIGYTYTEEGRRFYSLILTFHDGTKKNWTIDFVTYFWHERGNTKILCMGRFLGFTILGRSDHNSIMAQSLDFGQENGVDVVREAVTTNIDQHFMSLQFKHIIFEISRPGAPANDRTPGSMSLDWSEAGGDYRSDVRTKSLGADRIQFNNLGTSSVGRNFRVKITSSRRIQIESAYMEVDPWSGAWSYGI